MKFFYLVLLAIIGIHIFLIPQVLLKAPPVWSDESMYADVATNILREHRVATDMLSDSFPGAKTCVCGYPPGLYFLIAGWFSAFGFSIENQRALSIITGGLFLLMIALLVRSFLRDSSGSLSKNRWLWMLVVIGLLVDYAFLQSTRVARPEIFVLLFGSLASYFYLKIIEEKDRRRSLFYAFLSGLLSGFSVLVHVIAFFFPFSIILSMLITQKQRIFVSPKFYLFGLGLFLPLLVWLAFVYPYLDILEKQLNLSFSEKNIGEVWFYTVLSGSRFLTAKLAYLSYLLISIVFWAMSFFYFRRFELLGPNFKVKREKYLFLAILLFSAWAFSAYGKQSWYFVYPLPFVYLAIIILFVETQKIKLWPKEFLGHTSFIFAQTVFFLLLIFNGYADYYTFSRVTGENYSYHRLDRVLELVPRGQRVFLASGPDLYYILQKRGENKLYTFPTPVTQEGLISLLNQTDYAVYSAHYAVPHHGELLDNYIGQNSLESLEITGQKQYQVSVIRFKPLDLRVWPK